MPWDDEPMHRPALVVLVSLVACSSVGGTRSDERAGLSIRTAHGIVSLDVELADTAEERRMGLMGRENLDPYDGMAFVWDEPVETAFWMKDTLIPLSIAFWDEHGRIVSIIDMDPCEADPCPTYAPGIPFVGAVEVGQGGLARRGVEVGDHAELALPSG